MGELDGSDVLLKVTEPSLADQCQAAWVLLGCAAAEARGSVSAQLRRDVQDVLRMLDVAAPDVSRHRPGRERRGYLRKRR
jgi:hypothetical protein